MIKIFSSEWFGIKFEDIVHLSRENIAGEEFYESFYKEFFDRYESFDQIDADWRESKKIIGDFLASHIESGKVLSVGAGLGFIESYIHKKFGERIEIHVSDFSNVSNRWLRQILPKERIHGQDVGGDFDLIYVCIVDYALTDYEFVRMLTELSQALNAGGQLIILTEILNEGFWTSSLYRIKNFVKHFLEVLRVKKRSQFWGYLRTESDFRFMFQDADMYIHDLGFLDKKTFFFKITPGI